MKIIWTKLAKITYIEVLENLIENWTLKELKTFKRLTDNLLDRIKEGKISYPFANQKLGIKKGIIHKNVSLFYREDKNKEIIYLRWVLKIDFFSFLKRQEPFFIF